MSTPSSTAPCSPEYRQPVCSCGSHWRRSWSSSCPHPAPAIAQWCNLQLWSDLEAPCPGEFQSKIGGCLLTQNSVFERLCLPRRACKGILQQKYVIWEKKLRCLHSPLLTFHVIGRCSSEYTKVLLVDLHLDKIRPLANTARLVKTWIIRAVSASKDNKF